MALKMEEEKRKLLSSISDKNCEKGCSLALGLSEEFKQIVLQQQEVKTSKSNIHIQTFDDEEDQKYFNHMLHDIMIKTFDSPDEQKIFRKSLEGMNTNFPYILNGKENKMFYCPSAFNFDSRMEQTETSVLEALEEIQASLQTMQELTRKEKSNLKKIRDHLRKLRPQLAEQEFVDALACFFYQHRGIFIHSLKFEDHLKVLTNKARLHRSQNKNIGFTLTDFEKKLAKQFNISMQSLVDCANLVVSSLGNTEIERSGHKVNGRTIHEAIDTKLKGNEATYVKKIFKSDLDYTEEEIKEGVKLGKLNSECHIAGENDLLIMLPDKRLILCIEIKRHMSSKDLATQSNAFRKIDRNMISASCQLHKNAKFISTMHGAILSPEWRFVKVCAISPSLYNADSICNNCKKFILTTDLLKTCGGLDEWWKQTGLADSTENTIKETKDEAYNAFQLFFNRVVCMSSVKVLPDKFHTWEQVQGKNHHSIAAGLTKVKEEHDSNDISEGFDVGHALKSAHHAYKVLFLNKDQMALLTTSTVPSAVFICDFGAGNYVRK